MDALKFNKAEREHINNLVIADYKNTLRVIDKMNDPTLVDHYKQANGINKQIADKLLQVATYIKPTLFNTVELDKAIENEDKPYLQQAEDNELDNKIN